MPATVTVLSSMLVTSPESAVCRLAGRQTNAAQLQSTLRRWASVQWLVLRTQRRYGRLLTL